MGNKPKVFLICPVRSGELETVARVYVDTLEKFGWEVHYPPRDVDQTDDGVGMKICEAHRKAMLECDEVHIIYHPSSQGWLFDFGMAFVLEKPIVLVNEKDIEFPINKHYINVARELSKEYIKKKRESLWLKTQSQKKSG